MGEKRNNSKGISVMVLSGDEITAEIYKAIFAGKGYEVEAETDAYIAISKIRSRHFDILMLDYMMDTVNGEEIIRRIREFDKEIQIMVYIGKNEPAPPSRVISDFDIYSYFEKEGRMDQLQVLVDACAKNVRALRQIKELSLGTRSIMNGIPNLFTEDNESKMAEEMLSGALDMFSSEKGYIRLKASESGEIFKAYGTDDDERDERVWITAKLSDVFGNIDGEIAVKAEEGSLREELLGIYARQASYAASRNRMYEKLLGSLAENEEAYLQIVETLKATVEMKDRYTKGHSDRVAAIALFIAEEYGCDEKEKARIALAGSFHDIGKIGIPDTILLKGGKLTDDEYEAMKNHPLEGAKLLSGISRLQEILPAVSAHHERYDGTGYPYGKKGKEIPLEARIISIADAFDAMISDRSYREGMPIKTAVERIKAGRGNQFDPFVADVFINALEEKEIESMEELMKLVDE